MRRAGLWSFGRLVALACRGFKVERPCSDGPLLVPGAGAAFVQSLLTTKDSPAAPHLRSAADTAPAAAGGTPQGMTRSPDMRSDALHGHPPPSEVSNVRSRRRGARFRISARSRTSLGIGFVVFGVPVWAIDAILSPIPVWRSLGVIIGGALVGAGIVLVATAQ